MGVSGFYQETPSSPKLTKQRRPTPFFFTSRVKTPSTRVVVVPAPPPRPIYRPQPPSLRISPSLTPSLFYPPLGPAALGAALLRGGGDAATPIGLLPGTPQPEGGWPGARSSAGPAAPRRRHRGRAHPFALPPAPSFSPSVARGAQSRSLPRAVALPPVAQSSSLVAVPFPSSLRHVGHLMFFFSFPFFPLFLKFPPLALSTFHLPLRFPGSYFTPLLWACP